MFKFILIVLVVLLLNGCFASMEVTNNDLQLYNSSDQKIIVLMNVTYPDSTLKHAGVDRYLNPKENGYIGNFYELKKRATGVTIFVFDYAYFKSKSNNDVGTPDTYLEEDHILKKIVLSRNQLDSTKWILRFP